MTPGDAHEVKGYDALMEFYDIVPDRLLGEKGYDSDEVRGRSADRGIDPIIPPRSNRKAPINYDRDAYNRRNLIERCVTTASNNSVASPLATRKAPAPICLPCYVSNQ